MCTGCLDTQKQVQQALSSVRREAMEFAAQTGEPVLLYQTFEGDVAYVLESAMGTAPVKKPLEHILPQ